MALLRREHERGRGIILITHDMDMATRTDTAWVLQNGILHKQVME